MKSNVKLRMLYENKLKATVFLIVLCILQLHINAQIITFSSSNPAVPAANVAIPSTNQVIYSAVITLSGFNGSSSELTNITFTPSGTFTPSDINYYAFWWSQYNDFSLRQPTYPTAPPLAAGSPISLSINSPSFSDGKTYYFWITANISSNATLGHTLAIGALTPSNFQLSKGTLTGTMYPGGTQTLIATGPNIIVGAGSLMGFSYAVDNGPSAYQSYTVSGTSLTSDITLTAPADYEISTSNRFDGFSSTLSLSPQSGGSLPPTTLYVRLKSGLTVGNYNESIVLTSSNATTKNISCSGAVTCSLSPPTVVTPLTYCQNATATQLTATGQNLSWQTYGSSSVGGTIYPTNAGYNAPDNNNKTTSFTVSANVSSVTILSVDWDVPTNQTVAGIQIAIQQSDGSTIANGTQTNAPITTSQASYHQKQTSTFSNLVLTPGNYRIALVTGNGQFGAFNAPVYPQIESTGSINITGNTNGQVYYNLQFTYNKQSATAPTPSTVTVGTTNYSVTQTVSGCTSGAASIDVVISSTCPNYYRSTKSGDWNSATTSIWEYSVNKGTWTPTNTIPTINDVVTIQSGHIVTLSANATASSITINGTLDLGTNTLTGTGTLSVFSGGNLLIGGVSNYPSGFTSYLSIGSTVKYYKNGDQTVFLQTYNNLVLSGSGIKTTDGITVNGTLSIEGTATSPGIISNYGINSSLQYKGSTTQSIENNLVLLNKAYNLTIVNSNGVDLNTDFTSNNNLTVSSGTLTIKPAKTLTVKGDITNSVGNSGIVIKASPTAANGSLIFYKTQATPVSATVEMYSKANWNSAGVVDPETSISYYYNWQFFGIPVSTLTASPTFDGSYVRKWDETGKTKSDHWVSLTNGSSMLPFYGYEITQKVPVGNTIIFQGQLVNSNFTSGQLTISYNPLNMTNNALFPGQYIFANPYTAAIDIKQLSFGSGAQSTVYMYNTGSFASWNNANGNTLSDSTVFAPGQYIAVPYNTAGNSKLPRQIPSMQAFLIRPNDVAVATNYYLNFNYSSVVMKNSAQQRAPNTTDASSSEPVCTRIDVTGKNTIDRMWLFTQPGCTRNFDNGWDGAKIPGDAVAPQIFAIEPDNNYQVDAVDDMNNTVLGFQSGQDKDYTLTFTHQNLACQYSAVFLVDLAENKTIDITESGSTYSFTAESTSAPTKRFIIATRDVEKEVTNENTHLKIVVTGNIVLVQNSGNQNGELSLYDVLGHFIKKASFGPYGVTAVQAGSISGVYIATAIAGSEKVSTKIILDK